MKFECKNISKKYGSVIALREADLFLEKGEIRGIFGGNGSGKSTLAKIIGGVVQPDNGEMFLDEKNYQVLRPSQAKAVSVVVTSQELSLPTNLTVTENLVLQKLPTKWGPFLDKKGMRKKAAQVLARVGLSHLADTLVSELAPNQQYMVEFSKALVQNPKLLIIDEITSAFYREDVELFTKIVKDLSREGCSILFISHRMPEIFSICSSVTVMRNGLVISTHNIKDVNEDFLLGLLTGNPDHSEKVISGNSVENESCEYIEDMLYVNNFEMPSFNTSVNLRVKKGEVIGIAGLQGQGQSEFARTLFGLNGPVRIVLDLEETELYSPTEAVNKGLAFISGDREKEGAFYGRSISENLNAVNESVLKRKSFNEAELLKDMTVKYGSSSHNIETLSGGNQQKVIIGRWTATKPKLVLADDPTKGIDVKARRDVHDVLINLAKEGSSVLYISSDEEELVELVRKAEFSRIIVFYEGNIVKTLKGDDVELHNVIAASIPVSGGAA